MKTTPFVANWLKVGTKGLVVDNKPLDNLIQLTLYKNTTEANRVDKTLGLTEVGVLFGVFREDTSIVDESLLIQAEELPVFNYVYIDKLHRYYFVTDITTVTNKLWQIDLKEDVLMTYKDTIKGLTAFVDRNEKTYDPELIDKNRVIKQGVDIEDITIDNDVLKSGGQLKASYILTGFNVSPYLEVKK